MEEDLSYCAGQVRAHQHDRYLATLLAPAGARDALFALYAFDHEIARVRHIVSQPTGQVKDCSIATEALLSAPNYTRME